MLLMLLVLAADEGRYADGPPEGLEVRRRSLSLSLSDNLDLTGEGESSIISTHPEVSIGVPGAFFFFSFSFDLPEDPLSSLILESTLFRGLIISCMALATPVGVPKLERPEALPIRSLGTRV
jgi:hypothetical protein